MNIKTQASLSE